MTDQLVADRPAGSGQDDGCAEYLERIVYFLDNELDQADCQQVQLHLDECAPCLRKYDLERTVNGRKLRHNGHPVLRHHFDSVVASRGDTGLIRLHKGGRFDRIDAAIAAAMSVSRAVSNDIASRPPSS